MSERNCFTAPCLWDEQKQQEIMNIMPESGRKLTELYGTVPNEVIVTGRYNKVLDEMSKEKALDFKRNFVEKNGLKFAYLLNAPIDVKDVEEKKLEEYLDWIINRFRADSLTISSESLLKKVRELYPDVAINISTIAGIKNSDDFEKFAQFKPMRMVLHHDCVKDIVSLKTIREECEKNDIILELMVNESCLNHCPMRKAHYDCLADNTDDRRFHRICNAEKITNPYQFLYANYIRPEDIGLYSDMGIHYFKITGRSKPIWWHYEVVKAYLEGKYEGNLIRLLGIDPSLEAENLVYLDNQSLNGFALELMDDVDMQMEKCRKKIVELYRKRAFYSLKEGLEFEIAGEELVCMKGGNQIYE